MLGLAFVLLMSPAPASDPVCEVGRVAIAEFLTPASAGSDSFYGKVHPNEPDLLDACPDLATKLPQGYSIVDDKARKRASELGFDRPGKPASIHSIGIPEISADGQSATVDYAVVCGGLCGAGQQAKYVRTLNGWKREGGLLTLWVS